MRAVSPVPVLGVVRPGAVAAAAATRTGHVGVIATAGTVESGAYPAAISEADPALGRDASRRAPTWCRWSRPGELDGPQPSSAVRGYLGELFGADPQIDTLLLGCTHYPLLRPVIERQVGPGVAVVDSAFTTALAAEDLLDALGARSPADPPSR